MSEHYRVHLVVAGTNYLLERLHAQLVRFAQEQAEQAENAKSSELLR